MRGGLLARAVSTAAARVSMSARLNFRARATLRASVAEIAAADESDSETITVPLTGPNTVPARMMKRMADMSGRMVMKWSSAAYSGRLTQPRPPKKPAMISTSSANEGAPVYRLSTYMNTKVLKTWSTSEAMARPASPPAAAQPLPPIATATKSCRPATRSPPPASRRRPSPQPGNRCRGAPSAQSPHPRRRGRRAAGDDDVSPVRSRATTESTGLDAAPTTAHTTINRLASSMSSGPAARRCPKS